MITKMTLIAPLTLLFTACAATKPAAPQPRQFEGQRPQPPAQSQPAESPLKLTLPDGWLRAAPDETPEAIDSLLRNDALQAAILVAAYLTTNGSAPRDVAAAVAASLKESGVQVSEITVSPDGQSASFTWSNPAKGMTGKMAAKVLKDLPQLSVMFMGLWPAPANAAASADFDAIAGSVRVNAGK